MDTGKRDPRVDPAKGDLVRVGTTVRRVLRAERGGVWWVDNDRWIGCSHGGAEDLDQWRRDCSTATILHVAGEGEG